MSGDGLLSGDFGSDGSYEFTLRVQDQSYPPTYYFDDFSLSVSSVLNGDVDCTGDLNLLDILFLIDFIYNEGPDPVSMKSADCDCSQTCNLLDILYLISYIYDDGPEPCRY